MYHCGRKPRTEEASTEMERAEVELGPSRHVDGIEMSGSQETEEVAQAPDIHKLDVGVAPSAQKDETHVSGLKQTRDKTEQIAKRQAMYRKTFER